MKKRICFLLLCLIFLISLVSFNVKAETNKFFTISANPAEDSNTSMNFVWHTEKGVIGSYLLYTKKTDYTWINAVRIDAVSELNTAFAGKNAKYGTTSEELKVPYEFTKNTATAYNLEPGTEYMYKITDGTDTSDVRYFKTGKQEFNFVWVSDFHAYYSSATRLKAATVAVNKCISLENNGIDFIMSTGDIVAHGGTYQWWKQVSEASWMKNYMFFTTLGNHDWMTSVGTTYDNGSSYKFMDACFNNPKNGFAGQENICYYFYYGDALFISLNTETESAKYLNMTTDQFVKAQQDWVESVLQNNTAQYIFLFQHYQAFGTNGAYNSTGYTRWHNICDKYGVDIFFSGNSHVYMRSLPIYNGEISTDPSKGTVYMVAPSSDAERGVEYTAPTKNTDKIVKSWSESRSQAASLVEVTQDGIYLRLVNYDGTILDEVNILPKRLPTNNIDIDLSDFDKPQFENSFNVLVNQDTISNPNLIFSSNAHDVLRSIKVYNKDTLQTYYEGMVRKDATSCILNKVEKGNVNICVELRYADSTTKTLNFSINNIYNWGSISNPRITHNNDEYYIEWDEFIVSSRISSITIFLDRIRYDVVDAGVKKLLLPDYGGEHSVVIVVKDKDGDIVYSSSEMYYSLSQYYTVTFIDENGKLIEKVTVLEGENAKAPNYTPETGYKFVKWDRNFNNVTSNITVQAIVTSTNQTDTTRINNSLSCNSSSVVIYMISLLSICGLVIIKRKK